MKLLIQTAAAVAALAAAAPANAATILNTSGVSVQTLAPNANLDNNSLAGTVYLFLEGTTNGITSYLLHYDRTSFFGGQFNSGSFDISLGAGETFNSLVTSTIGLALTDPNNSVTYSNSPLRGLEPGSAILFGDDVSVGRPNPIHVTFDLSTAFGSLDEARFRINAAVPEPATWAMMLVGFGAIGFAMRRRQKTVTRVSYAS